MWKESETALRESEADKRALIEYERFLERIAVLGQTLGQARELKDILRAVRDFVVVSVPCDGMIVSLYEHDKKTRRAAYCWADDEEFELAKLVEIPVRNGITGRAIKSGTIVIDNDFQKCEQQMDVIIVGDCEGDKAPRSALSAPMALMGRTVGCIEIQSHQLNAYTAEHATAMHVAANLVANAIENVSLIQREREKAEQLRQAQKMEAVGQLAGGVAHDFNNLLTVITGYSDLSLKRLGQCDPLRKNIDEIRKAAERAASLTRQLLAFSRKQILQERILDLNSIVTDIEKMLRRVIGEDIELIAILDPLLGKIKADPGQIEQVIMNLAVNARDAMPRGGKLTIETGHVILDEACAQSDVSVTPGAYVMLAVSDNGSGIDSETEKRIFEPFFTTKAVGKGTGLGLATVYGIVKQSGGNIWVYSEVGKGTTFKIYLPIAERIAGLAEGSANPLETERGREVVLLVEDEEMVRNLTCEILETNGYKVLTATNGEQAYITCKEHIGAIDLMITDVVMPRMGGRELAEHIARIRPEMVVLFMSGYTDDAIVRHGVLDQDMPFLQKPFTPDSLCRKIREVLEHRKAC